MQRDRSWSLTVVHQGPEIQILNLVGSCASSLARQASVCYNADVDQVNWAIVPVAVFSASRLPINSCTSTHHLVHVTRRATVC